MSELKAGTAATNITPHLGTALAGSFRPRIADDVHDELYAKAMVLDDGATRLALVVCDLICAPREYLDRAKEMVEEWCDIPSSNVMIACTHTHTGPATADLLDVKQEREYMEFATRRIADSVRLAAGRLRACEIGFGMGREDRLVFNRRYWMKDGSVRTNPGYNNPDVVKPAGPVDPEVGVLCVREPSPEDLLAAEELLRATERANEREWVYAQDAVKFSRMPATMDTWVQALRIGDLGIVALSGEMFVEFGLEIKETSRFAGTFVVELANDYAGYVGTRSAYEEGGYETWLALSSRVTPDAGERMTEVALRLLGEVA